MISYLECPHLLTPEKKGFRDKVIKMYGINSNFVLSMLFGRFQGASGDNRIFNAVDMKSASRAVGGELASVRPGPRRAASDFSGGGDQQTLMVATGTEVEEIQLFRETNDIILARRLVETLKDMGIQPQDYVVDGGGAGATIINYMETDLKFVGIRKYLNNTRARITRRFYDRYTEDHYRLKRMLHMDYVSLPECEGTEQLLAQMKRRQYVEMENRRLKTEHKDRLRKRGESSPDVLDTIVMLMTDVLVEGFMDDTNDPDYVSKLGNEIPKVEKQSKMGDVFKQDRKSIADIMGGRGGAPKKNFFTKKG